MSQGRYGQRLQACKAQKPPIGKKEKPPIGKKEKPPIGKKTKPPIGKKKKPPMESSRRDGPKGAPAGPCPSAGHAVGDRRHTADVEPI